MESIRRWKKKNAKIESPKSPWVENLSTIHPYPFIHKLSRWQDPQKEKVQEVWKKIKEVLFSKQGKAWPRLFTRNSSASKGGDPLGWCSVWWRGREEGWIRYLPEPGGGGRHKSEWVHQRNPGAWSWVHDPNHWAQPDSVDLLKEQNKGI